ncbi:MAG: PEP-CTERM sorting domain-containing protein [Chthonomonas sp.]|nr:PEP-CTERM sorting domain-containing protein [Chthonomonas sp.]
MRKIAGLGFVAAALLPGFALAQARQFRYYLSYGDQQLVDLARSSGADLNAALGSEIPTGIALRVPSMGSFKVNLCVQHIAQGFGEVFVKNISGYVAYDRAFHRNVAFLSAPPLDTFSFRKVAPVFTGVDELQLNASDFGKRVVYNRQRNTVDENLDGVPDLAEYGGPNALGFGAYVAGNDDAYQVRPVGVSHSLDPLYPLANGMIASGWFKMLPDERLRICNLSYANALAVGESYGFASGETGLQLHTSNGEQTGYPNNLGYYRNSNMHPELWQHIGAKYTLIGAAPVPEPGGMVGLLAGLGILIRRRR